MTSAVTCPSCGADGTATADEMIAQTLAAQPAAPPTPPPVTRLRPVAAPIHAETPARPLAQPVSEASPKAAGEFNLGLGILGAFLGALLGAGAMYGFYEWAGFRFPLLGVGIGVLEPGCFTRARPTRWESFPASSRWWRWSGRCF